MRSEHISPELLLEERKKKEQGGPFHSEINLTNSQMLGMEMQYQRQQERQNLSDIRTVPKKTKGKKKRKKGKKGRKSRSVLDTDRAIMGQPLPFGGLMGANSFPGSDVTYTPPVNKYDDKPTVDHTEDIDKLEAADDQLIEQLDMSGDSLAQKLNIESNLLDESSRAIIGQKLPFGGLAGANSFPGPGITYTDSDSETHMENAEAETRAILGQPLPLAKDNALGEDSLPGSDIIFTPPTISTKKEMKKVKTGKSTLGLTT